MDVRFPIGSSVKGSLGKFPLGFNPTNQTITIGKNPKDFNPPEFLYKSFESKRP